MVDGEERNEWLFFYKNVEKYIYYIYIKVILMIE